MKEITIDNIVYVQKQQDLENNNKNMVLIRSYGSGVHFGILREEIDLLSGKSVVLINAQRIHYWEGAASLSQLAIDGIKYPENSRICVVVPEMTITQVIEIIPLSNKIYKHLCEIDKWKV